MKTNTCDPEIEIIVWRVSVLQFIQEVSFNISKTNFLVLSVLNPPLYTDIAMCNRFGIARVFNK